MCVHTWPGRIYTCLVINTMQSDGVLLFIMKSIPMYINFKRLTFGEFTSLKRDINPSHDGKSDVNQSHESLMGLHGDVNL